MPCLVLADGGRRAVGSHREASLHGVDDAVRGIERAGLTGTKNVLEESKLEAGPAHAGTPRRS
jgi:hypothetical protein